MELYYKVVKIGNEQEAAAIAYTKEHKASEPLFARRAAIEDAERMRPEGNDTNTATILVSLCFSPVNGFTTELPVHFISGNTDLSLLTHHSWALEVSLYYQYQYDTGGDIANYMGSLVLHDVLEQIKEDEY